jgi:hypothetical protein
MIGQTGGCYFDFFLMSEALKSREIMPAAMDFKA